MTKVVSVPIARQLITGTVNGATTLTRPNDTNAYAAGDEISDSVTAGSAHPFVFANVAVAAGGLFVVRRVLVSSTLQSANYRLALFSASPTMVGDNAAFGKTADRTNFLLNVAPAALGQAAGAEESFNAVDPNVFCACAAGATAIYGVLWASGAITPTAQAVFSVRLVVDQGI